MIVGVFLTIVGFLCWGVQDFVKTVHRTEDRQIETRNGVPWLRAEYICRVSEGDKCR